MWKYSDELYHHGVLGMKWGIRRYQNADGSLTPKGKQHLSKKLEKMTKKTNKRLAKTDLNRSINAYNKAANDMNNGEIDKYNKQYTQKIIKKIGAEKEKNYNYASDKDYIKGYEKLFNGRRKKYYDEMLISDVKKDKNYQKAKKLIDEYNMTSWDKNAKEIKKQIK